MATLEEAFAEAARNNRVCPQPRKWQELYNMLPSKRRVGNGWEPALPLILAAWDATSALSKILRLQEHLEWADSHGKLEDAYTFLSSLNENEWHHVGE